METTRDFDLRVANLVHHERHHCHSPFGTAGKDTFEFDAAASRDVTINGVRYHFDDAQVESVDFRRATATATTVVHSRRLGPATTPSPPRPSTPSSPTPTETPGFTVTMDGFEELQAYAKAGGHDEAFLYDSDANDKFKSEPAEELRQNVRRPDVQSGQVLRRVEAFSSGERTSHESSTPKATTPSRANKTSVGFAPTCSTSAFTTSAR